MFKVKRLITLAAAALAAAAAVTYAQRQLPTPEEAREIMRQRRERTRGTVTPREALLGVLRSRGAPGGLALLPQCGEEERLAVPGGATLPELLDSLVAAVPQYKWQSEHGIVNIIPAGGVPPLLDVRVAHFRAARVKTPDEALGHLLETPEVREAMSRPDVGWRLLRGKFSSYSPNAEGSEAAKSFSVSLDNLTVREALNAIARAHGRAMWTFRGNNCGRANFFELDFSVW